MWVKVGDTVDVFEYPGPDVNTEGGFEMPRVVRDAEVIQIDKARKKKMVTLRMSLFEKMRMNNGTSGFSIDRNNSDLDYVWVD